MSNGSHADTFDPFAARARRRTVAMWAAIAVCLAIIAVLLLAGLGDRAWSIGALLLILSCFGVCGWAGISSQHDIDEVVKEAKRLVAERQAAEDARSSTRADHRELRPSPGPSVRKAEGGSP